MITVILKRLVAYRGPWFALPIAVMALGLCGCQKKEKIVFEPSVQPAAWPELADGTFETPSEGYRIAVSERTRGLFPASIVVVRVQKTEDETSGADRLALAMSPPVDFLAWNSIFDDLRSVSEVFPSNAMAMDGQETTASTILSSAQALQARLCLTYTEAHPTANDAELRGVLVDVVTGAVVAAIRAGAHVDDPIEPDRKERIKELPAESEQRDPRLVAIRSFEDSARQCLMALMANDDPVEPVPPAGWVPERPLRPAIWPPIGERFDRNIYE